VRVVRVVRVDRVPADRLVVAPRRVEVLVADRVVADVFFADTFFADAFFTDVFFTDVFFTDVFFTDVFVVEGVRRVGGAVFLRIVPRHDGVPQRQR
jgi:hypothetical protein